ncbi:hypothetical protein [Asticcacaulis tiandongensis]|uniref:hypothetical protein n=1 Tax=Asticcacaulis tiandongensis TaxID=2565365 RepID=UPI0011291253|nr:hypothetical protein [Asticcacaulis tiandongensis]
MENLFHAYWWLIFPVLGMPLGMGMGYWAIYNQRKVKTETIKLIQTYLEQGKEPPPELLATLNDMPKGGKDSLTTIAVFSALSAAFGYFSFNGGGPLFMALAIGFGVGAVIALISAIIKHKQGKG